MRNVLLVPVLLALAACQAADLTAYHHDAAHPVVLRETQANLALAADTATAVTQARGFAAQRPNNGSTFVIMAPPAMAEALRAAIISEGVDPRDVVAAPVSVAAEMVRTDRFGALANCDVTPTRLSTWDSLTRVDEGFNHSNVNSQLLGCSVRGNIVRMTDDPRTLAGPVHADDRDGARSAEIYKKWVKGQAPYSNARLPTWNTSSATTGNAQ